MDFNYYFLATITFVALVVVLFLLIAKGIKYAVGKMDWEQAYKNKFIYTSLALILLWIAVLLVLASTGIFENFDTKPPRLFFAVFVPVLVLIYVLTRKSTKQLVSVVPPSWLIYIQSFRIIMELILWWAFLDNVIPVQMTFEGRNWDVLSGILAVVVGYFCFTRRSWPKSLAIAYNVVGLLLLLNIVVISVLSFPFPFRYFMNEPANTFVAQVPFILLPAFVVPVAYYMHALSLKQLLSK